MTRGERKDLNRRKEDARLRRHLPYQILGECLTTPAEIREKFPRTARFFIESHNCSCFSCQWHSTKWWGNSMARASVQVLRESARDREVLFNDSQAWRDWENHETDLTYYNGEEDEWGSHRNEPKSLRFYLGELFRKQFANLTIH